MKHIGFFSFWCLCISLFDLMISSSFLRDDYNIQESLSDCKQFTFISANEFFSYGDNNL